MKNKITVLLLIIIPGLISITSAQTLKYNFFRGSDLRGEVGFQTWSTEGNRITELSIPITYVIPISPKLTVNATTSSAFASLSTAEKSLNGITDTRINASYITMDDHLLLIGGLSLPTGKMTLEGDQNLVASALALYPLAFRVPSFGQGLAFNMFGYYAMKVENYILGGGAGFVYKNGFTPYSDNNAVYRPGAEFSINAGGETNANNRAPVKFTLDFTFTFYGADTYEGQDVFKSGTKIVIDARAITKFKNSDLMFFLRERTKGKNDKGYGSLMTEPKNSNGNQLEGGGMIFYPFAESVTFKGLLELKLHSENEYEVNGATIFGIGAGGNFILNNNIALDCMLKFSTGSLNNKSVSTSVTGFELGGGIKYRL